MMTTAMSIPTTSASVAALGTTSGPPSFSIKPRFVSLSASRGLFMARGTFSNIAANISSLHPIKSRMACTIEKRSGGSSANSKTSSFFMARRAVVGAGAVAALQGFMQWGAGDQASAASSFMEDFSETVMAPIANSVSHTKTPLESKIEEMEVALMELHEEEAEAEAKRVEDALVEARRLEQIEEARREAQAKAEQERVEEEAKKNEILAKMKAATEKKMQQTPTPGPLSGLQNVVKEVPKVTAPAASDLLGGLAQSGFAKIAGTGAAVALAGYLVGQSKAAEAAKAATESKAEAARREKEFNSVRQNLARQLASNSANAGLAPVEEKTAPAMTGTPKAAPTKAVPAVSVSAMPTSPSAKNLEEELSRVNAELEAKRKGESEANARMLVYRKEVEQARLRAGEMEWRVEKKALDMKDLQQQISALAAERDALSADVKRLQKDEVELVEKKKVIEEVEKLWNSEVQNRQAVEVMLGESEWRAERKNHDMNQLKKVMAEKVKEREEIEAEMKRMEKDVEELAVQRKLVQEANAKLALSLKETEEATSKLGTTEWRLEKNVGDVDNLKKQLAQKVLERAEMGVQVASLEDEVVQLALQKQLVKELNIELYVTKAESDAAKQAAGEMEYRYDRNVMDIRGLRKKIVEANAEVARLEGQVAEVAVQKQAVIDVTRNLEAARREADVAYAKIGEMEWRVDMRNMESRSLRVRVKEISAEEERKRSELRVSLQAKEAEAQALAADVSKVSAQLMEVKAAGQAVSLNLEAARKEVAAADMKVGELEWRVSRRDMEIRGLKTEMEKRLKERVEVDAEVVRLESEVMEGGLKLEMIKKEMMELMGSLDDVKGRLEGEEKEKNFYAKNLITTRKEAEAAKLKVAEMEWRADRHGSDITMLKSQIEKSVKEREETRAAMEEQKKAEEEIRKQLVASKEDLAAMELKVKQLEGVVESKCSQIQNLEASLQESQRKRDRLDSEVARLISEVAEGTRLLEAGKREIEKLNMSLESSAAKLREQEAMKQSMVERFEEIVGQARAQQEEVEEFRAKLIAAEQEVDAKAEKEEEIKAELSAATMSARQMSTKVEELVRKIEWANRESREKEDRMRNTRVEMEQMKQLVEKEKAVRMKLEREVGSGAADLEVAGQWASELADSHSMNADLAEELALKQRETADLSKDVFRERTRNAELVKELTLIYNQLEEEKKVAGAARAKLEATSFELNQGRSSVGELKTEMSDTEQVLGMMHREVVRAKGEIEEMAGRMRALEEYRSETEALIEEEAKKSAQLEQMVSAYGVEVHELRRLKEEAEDRRDSVERELREANQQMTLLKGEVTNLTRTLQATEAKVEKIEWVRAEAAMLVDEAERAAINEREENTKLIHKAKLLEADARAAVTMSAELAKVREELSTIKTSFGSSIGWGTHISDVGDEGSHIYTSTANRQ